MNYDRKNSNIKKTYEWFKTQKEWLDPEEFPKQYKDVFEMLLEKEVPFKVIGKPREKALCKCGIDLYDNSYHDSYCSNCGQKIDWGKEHE